MRRREFIAGASGAAALPLAARGQQQQLLPVIGLLSSQNPSSVAHLLVAFRQGLKERGYVEGQNVAFEVRWAEDRSERFAEIAAELVRLKVDVIFTYATPPVLALKQATSVIPIVFADFRNATCNSISLVGDLPDTICV